MKLDRKTRNVVEYSLEIARSSLAPLIEFDNHSAPLVKKAREGIDSQLRTQNSQRTANLTSEGAF